MAQRLDFLQHSFHSLELRKVTDFDVTNMDESADLRELQLSNIADRDVVRCRASLTIYLDAMVLEFRLSSIRPFAHVH